MTERIRTAYLVDDESLARYNLRRKLDNFSSIQIIGEADSVSSAIKKIPPSNPDILFLDIQLRDGSGFDILNSIKFGGEVIFVTSYDDYALRAFEINAVDYLMKPISVERLDSALHRLDVPNDNYRPVNLSKYKPDDRVMINNRDLIHFILIEDIVTIESSSDYSLVRTINSSEYIVSKTMNEWETRLPGNSFCRISRSAIVNLRFIEKSQKGINNTMVLFIQGNPNPFKIGRSYYKKMKMKYS